MRTFTQRLGDRRDLDSDANNAQLVRELCITIDDMGERIASELSRLDALVNAVDHLISVIRARRDV
jgi:hypothetical protein